MSETLNNVSEPLGRILQTIADTFDLSVEFVEAHAMEYILEYGRYACAKNTIEIGLFSTFVAIILGAIIILVLLDEVENERKMITIVTIVIAILWIFAVLYNLIMYLTSPLMYSIDVLMEVV